jgi:archaemetzincin
MRMLPIAAGSVLAAGVWLAVVLAPEDAPSKQTIPAAAIGDTSKLSQEEQQAFDPAGYLVLGKPGPHDWLANHPESGQTYEQFVAGRYNEPDQKRSKIYLAPIGGFPEATSPALADLTECASAYFGMPVELLDPLSLEGSGLTTRNNPNTYNRQVLATEVLDWLKKKLPKDAYCLLGITMTDLYPQPSWNFVFGMASIRERVGVFSFTRYDPAFYGQKRGPDFKQLMLRRSCKVLTHESGHMFGLLHCVHYECGMSGSNHLDESDSRPIHLCPVCLRKLMHSVKFDLMDRYRKLQAFYSRVKLDPEANWTAGRIQKIAH